MQPYIRDSIASIEDVLPLIKNRNKTNRVLINGEYVKITGLRLNTFAHHGITCSACGLTANYFALERTKCNEKYHLNLYGVLDGEEVLFTHDHTLARSLGGDDKLHNTTTMCLMCNQNKSVIEREIKERMIQDEKEKAVLGMSS